ncbi:SGNH/GDSL hydrolase family protein [uncultured Sphingomonas sp.]|uniref:SGNH/GDSL hydrolase family protein n=1 Tax=uncultured Sphingomonas sp. TaxID=158754 RepID=UPI0025EB8406|nr:SGNH/GDSL hydrolase family protein [uncultured Sphingomonas sp.]
MSKISALPIVAAPTGDETVVVLKDGIAQRADLAELTAPLVAEASAEADRAVAASKKAETEVATSLRGGGSLVNYALDANAQILPLVVNQETGAVLLGFDLGNNGAIVGQYAEGPINAVISPSFKQSLLYRYEAATDTIIPFFVGTDGGLILGFDTVAQKLVGAFAAGNGGGGGLTSHTPASPKLGVLNTGPNWTVERSAARLRMQRPIADDKDMRFATPAAKVGILTDAPIVEFDLAYTNLFTDNTNRKSVGVVLVDGVEHSTFTRAGTATFTVSLNFGSVAFRRVEILWPYADSLDLIALRYTAGYSAEPIRPRRRTFVPAGDSISQIYTANKTSEGWPYLLAEQRGLNLVNMGFGFRQSIAADATALAGIDADFVTRLIGYNDFAAQRPLAEFQASEQAWITNMRAALPYARLVYISPIYSTSNNAISLSSYRAAGRAAFDAVADPNSVFVDGLTLMTNSANRLVDGIHPNALGAAEMAAALAAYIK